MKDLRYCLVVCCLVLLSGLAGAAVVGTTIGQGATIFIGEEGLNVTDALIDAGGDTGTLTVIGWWPSAGAIFDTLPSATIDLGTRYQSMTVDPASFLGYTGNWYVVDGGYAARDAPIFTVADPALDLRIWDFGRNADVTGSSVQQGAHLGFRISTNMYPALDASRRSPVYNTSDGDGYIDIEVRNASGAIFTKLFINTAGTRAANLTRLNVTTAPWTWGTAGLDLATPYYWSTDAIDPSSGQPAYPPGIYTVIARSGLNNMTGNYRMGDADYTGKTVSPAYTITLAPDVPPVVGFSANRTSGPAPLAVLFADGSAGATGRAWFFGDETYSAPWKRMTAGAQWEARDWHSTVALPDGSIVLTGGWNGGNKGDVWRSANKGVTWTRMNASPGWEARHYHSSVALPDGSIVLTGGVGGSVYNDTWRSTDKGATWRRLNASSGWEERGYHSSVALADGSIVLTGGRDSNGNRRNDTWRSANTGVTWVRMSAGAGWSGRSHHSTVALADGSIVLTGGFDGSLNKNDTWRSTNKGVTWVRVNASSGWMARAGHITAAMPDGSIMLAGGFDGSRVYNDTWRSVDKGATWARVNASSGWSERGFHSSAVMTDGSIILTGGFDGNHFMNDTWRFAPAGSVAQNPTHTYSRPGAYSVTLHTYNANGSNSTRKIGYILVSAAPPAVTGITPANGIRGKTIVISNLSGTGFAAGAQVFLNKTGYPLITATNVRVVSAKKITCNITIPANALIGFRNIEVKNTNGKTGTKANAFMVRAPAAPTVTALQPKAGRRGTLVTITNLSGSGFIATPKPRVQLLRNSAVITATNVTVVSGNRIRCTFSIPSGSATGLWNASVINGDNQKGVKASAFTITL